MTDMDARIERAAMAMAQLHGTDRALWGMWRPEMETAFQAAFPELYTSPPSMWLAPSEPDKLMVMAGEDKLEEMTDEGYSSDANGNRYDYKELRSGSASHVYAAMRDAYLNSQKGGDVEQKAEA